MSDEFLHEAKEQLETYAMQLLSTNDVLRWLQRKILEARIDEHRKACEDTLEYCERFQELRRELEALK